MKKITLLQCLLCSFLLFVSIILIFRSNLRTSQAGAFGNSTAMNDTFEDLSNNFFKELLNE